MYKRIKAKTEPDMDSVKKTLSVLTCKCFACTHEKQKLQMPPLEEQTALNYCRNRLVKADDTIRVLTDI